MLSTITVKTRFMAKTIRQYFGGLKSITECLNGVTGGI